MIANDVTITRTLSVVIAFTSKPMILSSILEQNLPTLRETI